MKHYFMLFITLFKVSLMSAMICRANFALMLVQNIINILVAVFSFEYIFRHISQIGGWSQPEVIVLLCTAQVINALYRGLIGPNLNLFSYSINDGRFDLILLRPVSLLYSITLGRVDFSSLCSVFVPLYFVSVKIEQMGLQLSLMSIAGYIVFLIVGTCVVTALMMIVFSLSFVFVNVSKLEELYYSFMSIIEKPRDIFNKYWGFSFFFFIPLIPIANTPAMVLMSKGNLLYYLYSALVSILIVFLAALAVQSGVKKYEGASS